MDTIRIPSAQPDIGIRASHAAPVVIATDGRAQSDAALLIGRILGGDRDATRVVTVLRPVPMLPDAQAPLSPDLDAARRAEAIREARAQVERVWHDSDPDIELREGDPATAVAALAHESAATLIVAGLGRHRVADRIFGDETALRLIRIADRP